jgi:hypothetical protein
MKRLAWLSLTVFLTACGTDTTALNVDAGRGAGTGGTGDGSGGNGGAGRGRPDGSIEVTGGTGDDTGGTGGSTGGTGGSTGGTGGSTGGTGGSTGGTGGSTGGAGGSTGGAVGTGGATGGSGGPDGGAPDARMADAGDSCQACAGFALEYANAIRMEQACTQGAPGQCMKQTPGQLTCGCPVWVNTTALSDDVRSRYVAAGCTKCRPFIACPAIACVFPGVGTCGPLAAGSGGAATPAPNLNGQCTSKF